jgi:hypothetical protein
MNDFSWTKFNGTPAAFKLALATVPDAYVDFYDRLVLPVPYSYTKKQAFNTSLSQAGLVIFPGDAWDLSYIALATQSVGVGLVSDTAAQQALNSWDK